MKKPRKNIRHDSTHSPPPMDGLMLTQTMSKIPLRTLLSIVLLSMTCHSTRKLFGQFGTSAWFRVLPASCPLPISSLGRVGTGQSKKKRRPWCCSNTVQQYLELCYECHMRGQQLKKAIIYCPASYFCFNSLPTTKGQGFVLVDLDFFSPDLPSFLGTEKSSAKVLLSMEKAMYMSQHETYHTLKLPFYVKTFCTKASKGSVHGNIWPLLELEASSDGNQPGDGNGFEDDWLLIIPCKCSMLWPTCTNLWFCCIV